VREVRAVDLVGERLEFEMRFMRKKKIYRVPKLRRQLN